VVCHLFHFLGPSPQITTSKNNIMPYINETAAEEPALEPIAIVGMGKCFQASYDAIILQSSAT
jgi:hypothetical protein